jgi:hypothetical protein
MKLQLTEAMTFEAMAEALKASPELPYEITIKKNPLMRWQYIQVRKSGAVGAWIRVFPKRNRVLLLNAMPSALIRGLFGGLLLFIFTYSAQSKVRKKSGEILMEAFNTTTQ